MFLSSQKLAPFFNEILIYRRYFSQSLLHYVLVRLITIN